MISDIFRTGNLELPLSPSAAVPLQVAWIDMGVNRILVIVSVLLFLVALKALLRVAPHLLQSMARSRGCLNLEHSYSMATLRNISALVCLLPVCLIADRYSLLAFLFGWNLPQWAGSLAVFCILSAIVLLRKLICVAIAPGRMDYDYSKALNRTLYSMFILLCFTLMITSALSLVFDFSSELFCRIFLAQTAFFYIFSLLRTIQFLSVFCNGLATILYLCALEFVPLAAVVVACALLRL